MNFTKEQVKRYKRHLLLDEVSITGQKRLLESKVLCIGAGGLGAPALYYLAAAGVGTIGIADGDVVDFSNLQRQIVHFTKDVGRSKALSAKEKLSELNPDVNIILHEEFLRANNIAQVIEQYDFVLDGTDSFSSKFLINDACVMAHKAFSHGGILRFEGQVMTVVPGKSRCYRCIFKEPPPLNSIPTCSEAGVIGVLPGVIGSIQATETIKYLLGKGELLTDRLLIYDALSMRFRETRGKRNPKCPVCGDNPTILNLVDYGDPACDLP